MQTLLRLDIWIQSYSKFVNVKNNVKQENLNTVFANISKSLFPTSDSFPLIMSHMYRGLPPHSFAIDSSSRNIRHSVRIFMAFNTGVLF